MCPVELAVSFPIVRALSSKAHTPEKPFQFVQVPSSQS